MIEILGYFAAICTTISFLPQVIKTIKTRDTSGISLPMYIIFVSGVIAWMAYGYLISNITVMAANVVTLVLAGIVLAYKIIAVRSGKE